MYPVILILLLFFSLHMCFFPTAVVLNSLSKLFTDLFIYFENIMETEGGKGRFSIHLFTPQIVAIESFGPGSSQEPGVSSVGLALLVAGTKKLGPFSITFS